MPQQCRALNCKNKGFHRFPKDPLRRKEWESVLRIENFKATPNSRLCTAHFKEEDYFVISQYTGEESERMILKKTSVPSLFCFTKIKGENTISSERQERMEKRCQKKLFQDESLPSTSRDVLQHPSASQDLPQSLTSQDMPPNTACGLLTLEIANEEIVTLEIANEEIVTLEMANEEIVQEINTSSSTQLSSRKFTSSSSQVDHEHMFGSINRYKDDDKSILFYTGFESFKKFQFVYATLSPMVHKIKYYCKNVINLEAENQFFLTLMKLRQNKCNFELSKYFNVSETTVSNIFITWVNFIYQLWSKINIWPSKELVEYYMPESFKKYDRNIRVILDGTEIRVQKPKNPMSQQASWSSYKHANTLKILVGITPGGLLSYCSQAYAGSISDRQVVERSELMTKCQSGDSILADRGFTVQDMFADKNVSVKMPSFLKGKSQLPGVTIKKDRELANKRVHIERIIGLTKTYKILKSDLDHSYIPIASKIFFICFMCCNFKESIMKKRNKTL